MVSVGCSNKPIHCPTYPALLIYDKPEPIKVKVVKSKGDKAYTESLLKGLKDVAAKSRIQVKIIEAYESQVESYNGWLKNKDK